MIERLTDEELAKLARLENEEVAHPWREFRSPNGDYGIHDANDAAVAHIYGMETDANHLACVPLIVAMRNAFPKLLAEVRELRGMTRLS